MNVPRSSFYKWRQRNSNPSDRKKALAQNILLFQKYHNLYPSHGYRWLNAKIRLDENIVMSDPYALKCCKISGIKSKSKRGKFKKAGKPGRVFSNLICVDMNIDMPFQCI